MILSLKPASEYPTSFLADLMTRGFEGYIVPVSITEPVLHTMIRRDGIDLTSSRVLMRDDEPIGLAMIARRGWTSRLAAMGITSNARSGGVGTWAMQQLIEEAKARGGSTIAIAELPDLCTPVKTVIECEVHLCMLSLFEKGRTVALLVLFMYTGLRSTVSYSSRE